MTALDAVTPIVQMSWADLDEVRERKKETPFSGTSCIVNAEDEALWFSKNILPAIRKEEKLRETEALSPVWRHIGLYGYKRAALERFVSLPEGHYERLEGLEQLRFLENGMRIQAVKVAAAPSAMWGIDTPQDAAHAEKLIAEHGEPLAADALMTDIYIVRHGNTFDKGDVVTRVGARTDLPLSSSGRAQAEKLAAHFREVAPQGFSAAYCSPLQRTRQTAETILGAYDKRPDLDTCSISCARLITGPTKTSRKKK